jgi:hypothetical protein
MRLKLPVDVTKVVWVATAVRRSDQDGRDQRPSCRFRYALSGTWFEISVNKDLPLVARVLYD